MTIFEQYYEDNYIKWVKCLAHMIRNREEAEDRIQDIFVSLLPRTEFCEDLIAKNKMDLYFWCAVANQRAQVFRKKYKQLSTVGIDADNIDFLSSISTDSRGCMTVGVVAELELEDFYIKAVKLLENPRKLPSECGFETVGDVRQFILIQYARNGRTFQEIGELVNMTHQNIAAHYGKLVVILTPMIEDFIGRKLDPK